MSDTSESQELKKRRRLATDKRLNNWSEKQYKFMTLLHQTDPEYHEKQQKHCHISRENRYLKRYVAKLEQELIVLKNENEQLQQALTTKASSVSSFEDSPGYQEYIAWVNSGEDFKQAIDGWENDGGQ